MKKFLATLLALVMVFACTASFAEAAVDPETIPDECEAVNGIFHVKLPLASVLSVMPPA